MKIFYKPEKDSKDICNVLKNKISIWSKMFIERTLLELLKCTKFTLQKRTHYSNNKTE
jgi:hypothetical protein